MECMTCLYFPTKLWPFFSYTRVTSANFKLSENPLVSNVSEFHMFWGITSKTSEEPFKKLMGLLSNIPDFLEFKFKNSWLISFSVTLLNINCFHIFIITRVIFTEHYSSIDRIFFTRLLGVKFISGPTLFSNSYFQRNYWNVSVDSWSSEKILFPCSRDILEAIVHLSLTKGFIVVQISFLSVICDIFSI